MKVRIRENFLGWWLQCTLAFAGPLAIAGACAMNPVTGNRELALMSESQEIAIGRENDVQIEQEMGVYESPALQEYVAHLGKQLAAVSHRPGLPWQFTIVDSPAVNAFALPGGYIYLTRGIMAYLGDEAELAGVLGHEIGHVTARHAVQAYSRATGAQLGLVLGQIFVPPMEPNRYGLPGLTNAADSGLGLLFLKFGRDAEIQADRLGAEYAASGGWHPAGVADMLSTLGRLDESTDRRGVPNWLSTHPEPQARVAEISSTVSALVAALDQGSLRVDRGGYLTRIDGLRFGDNPEEGVFRGNEFLHAPLRFGLEFPAEWEVQNSETVVVARQTGKEVYMLLQLVEDSRGSDLATVANQKMSDVGYDFVSGDETTINGLDAYLASYQRQGDNGGQVIARVAHVRHDRNVFVFGGFGPLEEFARVEQDVNLSIRSFRPLNEEEVAGIVPNEINLYVVREGDTWQRIAQHVSGDAVQATILATLNGYPANQQPRVGELIKVVVAEQPERQERG